mgnify:CR=1 FL=1
MTTKKRIIASAFAITLAVSMVFGTKASISQNTVETKKAPTATNHYLKAGMSATDALNASNYQSTLPTGITCGGDPEVPCRYSFTPSEQYPTFQDFLNSKNSTTVVTSADETREQ